MKRTPKKRGKSMAKGREVEKRLCSYDPKAIREDPKVRKEATETAQDIMEKMKVYM